jgi:hypothetical protein
MKKKLFLVIAACAAAAVVFAGASSMACDGTASAKNASLNSWGCCNRSAHAGAWTHASGYHSKADGAWREGLCGKRGYYGANVYEVRDGRMWAVCWGKKFEVTENTPYTQLGEARYYFADEASKVACPYEMREMAERVDRETVALATVDGNVIGEENGRKIAQCIVTGRKFLVTADSPVMVADGKKYYMNDTTDLSSMAGVTGRR